jgi:hypothetical protein
MIDERERLTTIEAVANFAECAACGRVPESGCLMLAMFAATATGARFTQRTSKHIGYRDVVKMLVAWSVEVSPFDYTDVKRRIVAAVAVHEFPEPMSPKRQKRMMRKAFDAPDTSTGSLMRLDVAPVTSTPIAVKESADDPIDVLCREVGLKRRTAEYLSRRIAADRTFKVKCFQLMKAAGCINDGEDRRGVVRCVDDSTQAREVAQGESTPGAVFRQASAT